MGGDVGVLQQLLAAHVPEGSRQAHDQRSLDQKLHPLTPRVQVACSECIQYSTDHAIYSTMVQDGQPCTRGCCLRPDPRHKRHTDRPVQRSHTLRQGGAGHQNS